MRASGVGRGAKSAPSRDGKSAHTLESSVSLKSVLVSISPHSSFVGPQMDVALSET